MPASFFETGAVELFYRHRRAADFSRTDLGGGDDFGGEPTRDEVPYEPPTNYPFGAASPVSPSQPDLYRSGAAAPAVGGGPSPWLYLGSAVAAPDVEAVLIHTPVQSDYNAPAAFQKVHNSEFHRVTATLNRLNWRNWNFLRNGLKGTGADIVHNWKSGRLVLHSDDVELFVRYAVPSVGAVFAPVAAARGRIYYSALLTDYHETTVNSRVQEVTVIFECNPLYLKRDRLFWLFTERAADLPVLTPE